MTLTKQVKKSLQKNRDGPAAVKNRAAAPIGEAGGARPGIAPVKMSKEPSAERPGKRARVNVIYARGCAVGVPRELGV